MTQSDPTGPKQPVRPLHVVLLVLLLAAIALANSFVASRTTDVVQTSVTVSGDQTLNITLPNGKLISGRVLNVTGDAVMGAVVQPVGADGYVSQPVATGVTGTFQVAVRPGTYRLEVRPPFPRRDDFPALPRLVPMTTGASEVKSDTSVGDISLENGFLVTGQVSTSAGAAGNLFGQLLAIPSDGASPWLSTPAVFGTGASSRKYAVALPAGKFSLFFAGGQAFSSTWNMVRMSSFGAGKATVAKDMTTNIKLPAGSQLTGTVKDAAGKLLSGALWILKQGTGTMIERGFTVATVMNGKFILFLPTGTYDGVFLPLFDDSYTGRGTKTLVTFTMTTAAKDLQITTANGVVLSGKILTAKGKVIKTASLAAMPAGEDPASASAIPIPAKADEKTGVYRLCVPAGTYDIHAVPVGFGELSAFERLVVAEKP